MRRVLLVSLLLLAVTLCLPLLLCSTRRPPSEGELTATPSPSATAAVDETAPPEDPGTDGETVFTCLTDGTEKQVTMAEYLPGVLAGEMPASFEEEALKAQAVAARSYILYHMSHPAGAHPGAAVCDQVTCCLAYRDEQSLRELWGGSYSAYMEKMRKAVGETDGQYLTYEGEFIQAMFHSSSPGMTESSAALWVPIPYLVSVSSPETEKEVPNYITTVEVSVEDFRTSILGISPDSVLSGGPEAWLGEVKLDQSGRVESLVVGGKAITGSTMRGLFSLRSACFTLQYSGESFLFTVTGYGHGVGMSQYGANVMAKQGSSYREILAHYYPGTVLCPD